MAIEPHTAREGNLSTAARPCKSPGVNIEDRLRSRRKRIEKSIRWRLRKVPRVWYDAAAKALGVKTLPVEMHTPQELESAIAAMARQKARAVIVAPDPLFSTNRSRLAALALKNLLPP